LIQVKVMPSSPPALKAASPDCGDCPIRFRAVCAHCDASELGQLEKIKYYRSFTAGQPIAWSGERMGFMGSVVSGVASLSLAMEDGRRQMMGLLLPSDFVGRPGRDKAPYDVTAVSDLVLCCFRRAPFEDLLRSTPRVAGRLLEMTLDELDAAREWMLVLGRKTAREKIASLLAVLGRRDAALRHGRGPMVFDLALTREQMADYLGLTIETVSRQIGMMKRDGVIELRGLRTVAVPDFRRLLAEAGDDADGGLPV
jgi:CRP/FNR family transcriptional regulator